MSFPADVGLVIKSNLAVVTTLGEQIALLAKRLQESMSERPVYGLVTSVPVVSFHPAEDQPPLTALRRWATSPPMRAALIARHEQRQEERGKAIPVPRLLLARLAFGCSPLVNSLFSYPGVIEIRARSPIRKLPGGIAKCIQLKSWF